MSEMMSPNIFQPRGAWKATVRFKQYLDKTKTSPEDIQTIGGQIATALSNCWVFMTDSYAPAIVRDLRDVTDVEKLDNLLSEVFDICDDLRIWVPPANES